MLLFSRPGGGCSDKEEIKVTNQIANSQEKENEQGKKEE
jgi:hypothetical protein